MERSKSLDDIKCHTKEHFPMNDHIRKPATSKTIKISQQH